MEVMEIQAETRVGTGKRICKGLRREGKIPAIIYGGEGDSLPIAVNTAEVRKVLRSESGENSILRILYGKSQKVDAMLKDIQYDFLSTNLIHVDFLRIDLNKQVEVDVAVVLEGEPIGIKLEDGLLDFITREVRVRCLPTHIPHDIRVDISGLHTGNSVKVENLPAIEGVTYITASHIAICAVTNKGAEEAAPAAAADAAPAEAAAPAADAAKAAPAGAKPAAAGTEKKEG